MSQATLLDIYKAIETTRVVGITSHVSPDGDAIGSMLAMARLVERQGKSVFCILESPAKHGYRWLKGADRIVSPQEIQIPLDMLVVLDASRRERLGSVAKVIGSNTKLLVIDHHMEDEPDGDVTFVDATYAACGEIVAELFEVTHTPLDPEVATWLYVAIATDTGGFRYASTSARSHYLAARMLECGINAGEITRRCFDAMTPAKFNLMARILGRMQFLMNSRLAYSEIYPSDLLETGAGAEDINNLINWGRNVEGVKVAILFRSIDPQTTKVSVRACPEFNALKLITPFGGGGHVGAAGATLAMPLDEARRAILEYAKQLLEEHP